jgi:hypothetical protein
MNEGLYEVVRESEVKKCSCCGRTFVVEEGLEDLSLKFIVGLMLWAVFLFFIMFWIPMFMNSNITVSFW